MFLNISYSFLKSAVLGSMALFLLCSCKNAEKFSDEADYWQTTADKKELLQKHSSAIFSDENINAPILWINPEKQYQYIDGFGYTLTGGSVEVINSLSPEKRKALLQELFGNGKNDISISYLRLSIGASDLDGSVFSYDDLPEGLKDPELQYFNLSQDKANIEMLQEILKINPKIKLIATPWSAPVWMKDNGKTIGGSLKPEYYETYAHYFLKYILEMQKKGIKIDAITPQNEPLHPGNNPSMYMPAEQQKIFIKNYLGPLFKENNIKTKIVIYDHNCNKPEYPLSILSDPEANKYIDGSAFHLYEGHISALTTVHDAFPDKNLYFTEQWTGAQGNFAQDLMWHTRNVIIGSMKNWSKSALEWNLANDENFEPHTPGGCTECKGALTIRKNGMIERNVGYYIIAHASKFVPPGSVRIDSSIIPDIDVVAFRTPEGKTVIILVNASDREQRFAIALSGKKAMVRLNAEAVATFVF